MNWKVQSLFFTLFFIVYSLSLTAQVGTTHAIIVDDAFINGDDRIPECHASTIVELDNGDLLVAFFGGLKEGFPDCNIWLTRKTKGSTEWSVPKVVADGIYTEYTKSAFSQKDLEDFAKRELHEEWWMKPAENSGDPLISTKIRKPCYNPVLTQIPGGDLVLYYKIGSFVQDWTGWQIRSKDGGKTWSHPIPLPENFLGPIKNKPVYVKNRYINPSSTEKGGWKFHFEISDDKGESWKYVGPIEAEMSVQTENMLDSIPAAMPIQCIQPSILFLPDGQLEAIGRTRNGQLAVTYSNDNGDTWSKVQLSELPNNNSGTDALTLADGRHVIAYNDSKPQPGQSGGPRTPLCLAISVDGKHWNKLLTLEDSKIGEYSYPSIIQGRNGNLYVVYTWRRQRIVFKEIALREILFETTSSDTIPYRIPAIASTSDGDVLALTDYRYCKLDIGFGRIDIHGRLSSDYGKTWGKEFLVARGSGIHGALDCGFGDAALVADRESNEVLLVTVCGETVYTAPTTTRQNPNRVALMRSHDNGKTWTKFKEITESIYSLFDKSSLGPVQSLFFSSGRIFQSRTVKVGSHYRLYVSLSARPNGNRVIYSDDFGNTWKALGDINILPAPNGDESKCEELPDGRLILSSRVRGGRYFNVYTFSDVKSGKGHWDKVSFSGAENDGTIAENNATNGEILVLPAKRVKDGKATHLILQSVPLGPERKNVGIYYKELDDKVSISSLNLASNWRGPYKITDMDSAYSTMIQQADGSIGFLYEETTYGADYCLVYKNLKLKDITEGAYY